MSADIKINNKSIKAKTLEVKLEFTPQFRKNVEEAFARDTGNELQKYIDKEILGSIEPYVPRDNGVLVNSAENNTTIGNGEITWEGPQALLLYNGIIMVDPKFKFGGLMLNPNDGGWISRKGIKKIPDPEGRTFNYGGGGRRGSHWCERWMRDNLATLEANVQKKAGELLYR